MSQKIDLPPDPPVGEVPLQGWSAIMRQAGYKSIDQFQRVVENDKRWQMVIRESKTRRSRRYRKVFAFPSQVHWVMATTPTLKQVTA